MNENMDIRMSPFEKKHSLKNSRSKIHVLFNIAPGALPSLFTKLHMALPKELQPYIEGTSWPHGTIDADWKKGAPNEKLSGKFLNPFALKTSIIPWKAVDPNEQKDTFVQRIISDLKKPENERTAYELDEDQWNAVIAKIKGSIDANTWQMIMEPTQGKIEPLSKDLINQYQLTQDERDKILGSKLVIDDETAAEYVTDVILPARRVKRENQQAVKGESYYRSPREWDSHEINDTFLLNMKNSAEKKYSGLFQHRAHDAEALMELLVQGAITVATMTQIDSDTAGHKEVREELNKMVCIIVKRMFSLDKITKDKGAAAAVALGRQENTEEEAQWETEYNTNVRVVNSTQRGRGRGNNAFAFRGGRGTGGGGGWTPRGQYRGRGRGGDRGRGRGGKDHAAGEDGDG